MNQYRLPLYLCRNLNMNQHPKNKPAVPFDVTSEQAQTKKASKPKLRTPEEIAFTAQELEKNISRLSQNVPPPSNPPIPGNSPSQNFDALDYVSLSLSSPQSTERKPAAGEPIENAPNVDPYIDPSELAKPDSKNPYNAIPDQFSTAGLSQSPATTSPHEPVSPLHELPLNNTQSEAPRKTTKTGDVPQRPLEKQNNMPTQEAFPTATWFSDPLSVITPRTNTPTEPHPIVADLKPEPSEPLHDIRNFRDSASGKIELIRGAYRADSESQAIQSPPLQPIEKTDSKIHSKTANSKSEDIFDKDEVFLARTGDVIEVNGEDGFDRIDLACYDINCASISSNKIRIDDEQTGSFEIHFTGVDYAIFANGVKIRLNTAN